MRTEEVSISSRKKCEKRNNGKEKRSSRRRDVTSIQLKIGFGKDRFKGQST
uniref:Uncharacterized protein n=1 Tax=Ditylenchus dipsaci TaxID=166011 RepID=A0A915EJL5_9BILA